MSLDDRKPMRRVSKRRARENRERRRNLHARYGSNPPCYLGPVLTGARLVPADWCNGWADDGHEVLTRGRGGSIVDPDNVLPACRPCHRYVTDHPQEAEQVGLVRSANG